jgi:hypothetical protein
MEREKNKNGSGIPPTLTHTNPKQLTAASAG